MKKVAPSEQKKQQIDELLRGQGEQAGGELLNELIRCSVAALVQEVVEREQAEFLGRARYERTGAGEPKLHRNGYEPGKLKTAEGVVEVQLPQVRGGAAPYRSAVWERLNGGELSAGLRRLVVEMYVGGMSTRDIEAALGQSLGEFVISKSQVSTISAELSAQYDAFKQRELNGFDVAYLFFDAVYEPLRRYGAKTGVLCCWAILADGSRALIDLTTANSESREACTDFLRHMVSRGLRPPLTVTCDGAPGLLSALDAMWPQSKRIRCWFHKMQNVQQKVPPQAWPAFKVLLNDVRDAPTLAEGQQRLHQLLAAHEQTLPEACRCLRDDQQASLNHLWVPHRHRQMVRTTNLVERSFVEERRRTKTIPHLWDEASLVQLVFAVLIRVSDRWAARQFSLIETRMIQKLREEILGINHQPYSPPERSSRRSAGDAFTGG